MQRLPAALPDLGRYREEAELASPATAIVRAERAALRCQSG